MRSRSVRLLLGLDPALRSLGWAIASRAGGSLVPLAMGLVETERDARMKRSADNRRAIRIIARALRDLVRWTPNGPGDEVTVDAICAEAMSYPPGAIGPALISLCWGSIETTAERDGIEVFEASPQRIKRAVAGSPSASKAEMQAALNAMFGAREMHRMLSGVPDGDREHPYDGLGAIVTLAG